MPYTNEPKETKRSKAEAWDMALDNKYLMFQVLNKYVSTHSLPYYRGEDLLRELESVAWEGFYDACLKWDEDKGALSTYAWPAIINNLNARMKVLSKMGSTMHGHYAKGESQVPRPQLSSLEKLDETNAKAFDNETRNNLSDLKAQPWQEPKPSLEDSIISKLDNEALMAKIFSILGTMQEPYAEVFRLCYLSEPTHERNTGGNGFTLGLTLREVGNKYGRSTTWVKEILDEATEYIRNHLAVEGYYGIDD